MLILDNTYNIIIGSAVGSAGHDRDVVDCVNDIDKFYINANGKSAIAWIKGSWKSYGITHVQPYRRYQKNH